MRHTLDKELKGHALVFRGPLELVELARKGSEADPKAFYHDRNMRATWPGRTGRGWQDMVNFLHSPWPQALAKVEYVQQKAREAHLPEPKSMKRKARWDENEGEVEVDRCLHGDPDFYRKVRRERTVGPMHIALVGGIDVPHNINPSGLFYRSMAAIAVTDILEDLGYTVEVHLWCRGHAVYPMPYHNQFVAFKVKEAGQTMDKTAMCDAMAGWFGRAACASFWACPVTPVGLGVMDEINEYATCVEDSNISGWLKYLDVTEGVLKVPVPMVYGHEDNAVHAAKRVLENILAKQESGG